MPAPKLSKGEHLARIADPDRTSSALAVRRLQRSLSLVVREGFDPAWYLQWQLMVLSGRTPILVEDKRCAMGYRVAHDETASAPTREEKAKALKELMDRGHGLPVQQLLLDAELRGQIATLQAELDLQQISGALTMEQRARIASIFGVQIGGANVKELAAGVIDVPATEDEDEDEDEDDSEG